MPDIAAGTAGTVLSVGAPHLEPRPPDPESLHELAGSAALDKP